jgi:hypothetical protein
LKTIQIPSPSSGRGVKQCLDFGDTLEICFEADGTFTPDGNGWRFTPPLVPMAVHKFDLAGPYTPQPTRFDVTWTFQPSSGLPDNGEIEVKKDATCRQTSNPPCGPTVHTGGPVLLMRTIQIPGSRDQHGRVDEVGEDCLVDLHFTKDGLFKRSAQGDAFHPAMFHGEAKAGSDHPCTSPNEQLDVHWSFTASDGKPSDGIIRVRKGASCTDPKTPKHHSRS